MEFKDIRTATNSRGLDSDVDLDICSNSELNENLEIGLCERHTGRTGNSDIIENCVKTNPWSSAIECTIVTTIDQICLSSDFLRMEDGVNLGRHHFMECH